MTKHSFWRLGVIGMSAISGIELALWDIFGKSAGLPVWRLLGGKVRDRVRVYTHLGMGDHALRLRVDGDRRDGRQSTGKWLGPVIARSRLCSFRTRTTRRQPKTSTMRHG